MFLSKFRFRRAAAGAAAALLLFALPTAGLAEISAPMSTTAAPMPAKSMEPSPMPTPTISSDQALTLLKKLFPVPEQSETLTMETYLNRHPAGVVWDFQVMIREANGGYGYSLAQVDAMTGRILSYDGGSILRRAIRIGPAKAQSINQARFVAWDLLNAIIPRAERDRLKLVEPSGTDGIAYYYGAVSTDQYTFGWVEHVDGIPVPSSRIDIAVDKETLDVTSFRSNLQSNLTFAKGPAKVTPDEAMAHWRAAAEPRLVYAQTPAKYSYPYYGYPYGPTPASYKLAYQFNNLYRTVDALTGEFTSEGPVPYGLPQAAPDAAPVPKGETEPIKPAALPVTDEVGKAYIAEVFGLDAASMMLRRETWAFEPYHYYHWSHPQGKGGGSATLDPKTGLIRGANRYMYEPSQPVAEVTPELEEKALQAAIAVVQRFFGPYVDQVRVVAEQPPVGYYGRDNSDRRFSFPRYKDGIQVLGNELSVTIDLGTLQWRDFHANWTEGIELPSTDGIISPAEAADRLFQDRKPELLYRPVLPDGAYDPSIPWEMRPQATEAALVYALKSATGMAAMIDAQTGEAVTYYGEAMNSVDEAVKQVQGHWAEGALIVMLRRGIFSPKGFSPEAPVSRAEALSLLLMANERSNEGFGRFPGELPFTDVASTHPAYGAVLTAVNRGWLRPEAAEKNFRPDEPVTQVEFAVWMARSLGFGDLIKANLKLQSGYPAGWTNEERNAVEFLQALGLFPQEDLLLGRDSLTAAEGAAMAAKLYNYRLEKR